MSKNTKNIILWVLTGLVGFVFIGSATSKLLASPETLQAVEKIGLNPTSLLVIGIVEITSVILFIIPRTGILGTLLLAAYMGGAIATHVEHGDSFIAQAVIEAFVWIVAVLRFPELTTRFFGKK